MASFVCIIARVNAPDGDQLHVNVVDCKTDVFNIAFAYERSNYIIDFMVYGAIGDVRDPKFYGFGHFDKWVTEFNYGTQG